MESSFIIPFSRQLSFLSMKPNRNSSYPSWPWRQRNPSQLSIRLNCQKMYVPGFGEASPEAKAAKNLHNFFTYVAVRIVSAQLEVFWKPIGIGYLSAQSYNTEAYEELMGFWDKHSLNDGDQFCADLMRESSSHKKLALRILEVRSAYCKHDFEWENLKKLSSKMAEDSNKRLMREYILETSHIENEK